MIKKSKDAFPFHKDYGLPDEVRIRAVRQAAIIGVRKTSKLMNISEGSIYNWRKAVKYQPLNKV